MNLFKYLKYRDFLKSLIKKAKALDRKLRIASVARAGGMQPTYFSNVMNQRGNLSADQFYEILLALGASPQEREYGLLLLDLERCSSALRRKHLKSQIESIRSHHLKTHIEIDIVPTQTDTTEQMQYYLEPHTILVHIGLSIPRFSDQPDLLRKALRMNSEHFTAVLRFLEKYGYLRRDGQGRIHCEKSVTHLPEDSPLCLPHRTLLRKVCDEKSRTVSSQRKKSISSTISISEKNADKLQEEIMQLLARAKQLVEEGEPEQLIQLNIDYLPWTNPAEK